MAHPEVPSAILLLPLHDPQHSRHPTLALWRELWMQVLPVISIRDVNSFVSCYRMGIDSERGRDAVFPFFLHFRVHYEEGVVREVDGDLTLGICVVLGF